MLWDDIYQLSTLSFQVSSIRITKYLKHLINCDYKFRNCTKCTRDIRGIIALSRRHKVINFARIKK